jgi:DNA-binding MarR family transcriptional regulator
MIRSSLGAPEADMHKSAADAPSLGRTLRFLRVLWDLNHALEVTSSRMYRSLGVTAQQRFLIRIVGRTGPLSAGQLALLLHVHPGTLSTALRRLEARQLLERRRDPADARRILIALTPRGRKIDCASAGTVESAVRAVLRRSSPADAGAVARIMRRLAAQLRSEDRRS